MTRKFQDVYLPALKANFMLWPGVQLINFRLMPVRFQIVFYQDLLFRVVMLISTASLLCQQSVSPGQRICL